MQLLVIYTKIALPGSKIFPKHPEYPDEYPEYPDSQVRSFRGYTRSFARSVPNPEYPGLYPVFRPEFSKPGVSGLIPGVSGLDSIFAPKTEILIFGKTTPPNLKPS